MTFPSWTWPRWVGKAGVAALLASLVAVPWIVGPYAVSVMSYGLTIAVIAASAHLLNTAGQPSLGQAAYAGAGAYASGYVATHLSTHVLPQLIAALAASLLTGAIAATVLARLRGMTFLLATLAVGELGYTAAEQLPFLGAQSMPPVTLTPSTPPLTSDGHLYLYALACTIICLAALRLTTTSRLGPRLAGVAAGERRLHSAGISGTATVWQTVLVSAGVAGVAGHLLVATRRFVSPADAGFDVSALALIAAIIGMRSLLATTAAAVGLVLLRDLAGNEVTGYGPVILAVAFLTVALLRATTARRRRNGPP